MASTGVHIDNDLLALAALLHLPDERKATKEVMIATSETTGTSLSLSTVLGQIKDLCRDANINVPKASNILGSKPNALAAVERNFN